MLRRQIQIIFLKNILTITRNKESKVFLSKYPNKLLNARQADMFVCLSPWLNRYFILADCSLANSDTEIRQM